MSENLHDIDKLFRDSIEGHEEMPSGKVWDDIDHQLDKGNVVLTKRKYNNLKLLSAALLLLLIGAIVYQVNTKKYYEANAGKNNAAVNNKANPAVPGNPAIKEDVNSSKNEAATETGNPTNNAGAGIPVKPGKNEGQDYTEKSAAPEAVNATTTAGAAISVRADKKENLDHPKTSAAEDMGNSKALKTSVKNNVKAPVTNTVNKTENKKDKNIAAISKRKGKNITDVLPVNNIQKQYADNSTAKKNIKARPDKNSVKKSPRQEINLEQDTYTGQTNENKAGDQNIYGDKKTTIESAVTVRPLVSTLVERNADETSKLPVAVQINEESAKPGLIFEAGSAKINLTKKPGYFHFSIMPFYSAQFSFNRIEEDNGPGRGGPQGPNNRDKIKNDETYKASSSWGIAVEIPLAKKWSLQSGISHISKNLVIEPKKIFAQLDNDGKVKYRFDCSSGYTYLSPKAGTTPVVGDSITVAQSSNNLQYIGVPLAINYTFFTGKFNVVPTLGAMANFLVKQNIETSLEPGVSNAKQNITSIQGLRSTYFNAIAGIAFQYNISKRISLNIVPAGNFALNSINKDATVKSYPNSFSVAGGIKIQF